MLESDLKRLGRAVANLRVARNLQQAELAYEAGVSERTLQRFESGAVVKIDCLVKVLSYLGLFDEVLTLLSAPQVSPSNLAKQVRRSSASESATKKMRVRKPVDKKVGHTSNDSSEGVAWTWPEDQK